MYFHIFVSVCQCIILSLPIQWNLQYLKTSGLFNLWRLFRDNGLNEGDSKQKALPIKSHGILECLWNLVIW